MELSAFDHGVAPPRWTFPRSYNAAYDLIERNLRAGRCGKIAYVDDDGAYTYDELGARVNRCASALTGLGIPPEARIMLCLLDTVDYPSLFLGAIKAGIVPIPTNTMLSSKDYRSMLADSTAQALVVSDTVLPAFEPILASLPHLRHVIIVGENARGRPRLYDLIRDASDRFEPSQTSVDDMCYWLCTSGSTGTPKGAVHLHSHLMLSAELYARGILAMCEDDIILSASKLFFTYGLGTSLTFPIATGARTILTAARSTPETMFKLLAQHRPTVFFGIPSLYAAMLAMADPPERSALRLRVCVSAGEPLPAEIGKRWRERFGCDILDGMGSSEMGHIFISNRSDELRYGSSGKPV